MNKTNDKLKAQACQIKATTRYGIKWSNDGQTWLAIVNDKTLEDAESHFRANAAKFKRLVKQEICETILKEI